MSQQILDEIEGRQFKESLPEFRAGDTLRVGVRVVEGSRERVQEFEGVVIRRRSGGINENFTVRRIASHGIGVERTFLLHSPRLDSIKVIRHGKVRRAKLYYLRGLTGKAWVSRPPIGRDLPAAPPAIPEAAKGVPDQT